MGLRNWNTGQVWAEYRNVATGELIPGHVTVSLPLLLTNIADDAVIPSGILINQQPLNTVEDAVAADGRSFDFTLPGTDDPDIEQGDWGWVITVTLSGFSRLTYNKVPIPVGGSTNLRTIVPTVAATTVPQASLNLNMFARIQDGLIVDKDGNPLTTGGGSVAFIEDPAAPGLFQVGA